jgi:hypothetical protein
MKKSAMSVLLINVNFTQFFALNLHQTLKRNEKMHFCTGQIEKKIKNNGAIFCLSTTEQAPVVLKASTPK